jgi:hydroxymethylbilane synthase
MKDQRPIILCTRGSPLALFQARQIMDFAQKLFPGRTFELNILKTTGDALQTANPQDTSTALPMGLFTKELEQALLEERGDIAVHSLKDLPTELPEGLCLAGVGLRQDVRDVLIYRDVNTPIKQAETLDEWRPGSHKPQRFRAGTALDRMPEGTVVATGSTRRAALLTALNRGLKVVPIRGNVGTRLKKLADRQDFDATLLAAAGLTRLGMMEGPKGQLQLHPHRAKEPEIEHPPLGLSMTVLDPTEFLPAVGQGAVGLETRSDDDEILSLCKKLTHGNTLHAVMAERAFLRAMGGGCQSPIGAYARVVGHQLHLRVVVFHEGQVVRSEGRRVVRESEALGKAMAEDVLQQLNRG